MIPDSLKFVSLDIETTGLLPEIHDVMEIGAVFDDLSMESMPEQIPLRIVVVKREYLMTPYCGILHEKLLREIEDIPSNTKQKIFDGDKHAFDPETATNYCSPESVEKVLHTYRDILAAHLFDRKDPLTLAGKNLGLFDIPFLNKTFNFRRAMRYHQRLLDPSPFFYKPGDDVLPSLGLCMERASTEGWDFPLDEVAHTSVEDAQIVASLLRFKMRGPNVVMSPLPLKRFPKAEDVPQCGIKPEDGWA